MVRVLLFLLVSMASVFAQQAEPPPTKGFALVQFGSVDKKGVISEKTDIPWELGGCYGWRAMIVSPAPTVTLREVLTLPGRATWNLPPQQPGGLVKERRENVTDDRVLTREVKLDTSQPLFYGNTYEFIAGDPEGEHVLEIFIDGKLVKKFKFYIEKPRA